ncbi:hypothetical protein EUTSA_v10015974mg [Eutrema salsugineum]|uniref:Embryo surrounding factor 1 brassicaceae domain-containing protein n=1 Tax=Eutrema salsugineum TaxID=72664 RepID=V4LMA3_EUTSA|nr:EMBRYO SURROUNDING FACTOR 1-like protein 3 [Eutrema salsugineum]ESQ43557.1 hypothetical protein EUTSA_v10015974mg [Eutrema salsugineum]
MKSSQIALICIVIFSLFALHEGARSDLYIPSCVKQSCDGFIFNKDCWCCFEPKVHKNACWKADHPNAKEICFQECSRKI